MSRGRHYGFLTRRCVAALLLAALLTACGGDEGVTLAEWRAGANDVCADARREVAKLGRPRQRAQVRPYIARTTAIGRRFVARLRELEKPERARARIDRLIRAYQQIIPAQQRLADAYDAGDARAADRAVADVRRLGGEADRIAEALGADECARDPVGG